MCDTDVTCELKRGSVVRLVALIITNPYAELFSAQ
jgi:hypothetical protein